MERKREPGLELEYDLTHRYWVKEDCVMPRKLREEMRCKNGILRVQILSIWAEGWFCSMHGHFRASLVAQMVGNPPVMRETWIQLLGWEDPLEEGIATPSSTLAWRIPIDRGAWWLQSLRFQRAGHDWVTKHITHGHCNVCHVFPRLLVVCESLCCDFLRMKSWKEHSTLWKCYNGKLFQASRSQNLRGFSVFFFFFYLWFWFWAR